MFILRRRAFPSWRGWLHHAQRQHQDEAGTIVHCVKTVVVDSRQLFLTSARQSPGHFYCGLRSALLSLSSPIPLKESPPQPMSWNTPLTKSPMTMGKVGLTPKAHKSARHRHRWLLNNSAAEPGQVQNFRMQTISRQVNRRFQRPARQPGFIRQARLHCYGRGMNRTPLEAKTSPAARLVLCRQH